MEDSQLKYEIKNGIRYAVGYNTHDSHTFYLGKLSTSQEEVNKAALKMIREKPSLAEKLSLVKVKALEGVCLEGEVMLWTKNSKFFELEKICEQFSRARSLITGTKLVKHVLISPFEKEVVKDYKNESRA